MKKALGILALAGLSLASDFADDEFLSIPVKQPSSFPFVKHVLFGTNKDALQANDEFFVDYADDEFFVDYADDELFVDYADDELFVDYADDEFFADYADDELFVDYADDEFFVDYADDEFFADYADDEFFVDYADDEFFVDYADDELFVDYADDELFVDYADDELFADYADDELFVDYADDEFFVDYADDEKYSVQPGGKNTLHMRTYEHAASWSKGSIGYKPNPFNYPIYLDDNELAIFPKIVNRLNAKKEEVVDKVKKIPFFNFLDDVAVQGKVQVHPFQPALRLKLFQKLDQSHLVNQE